MFLFLTGEKKGRRSIKDSVFVQLTSWHRPLYIAFYIVAFVTFLLTGKQKPNSVLGRLDSKEYVIVYLCQFLPIDR